jgi:hypothetical protein
MDAALALLQNGKTVQTLQSTTKALGDAIDLVDEEVLGALIGILNIGNETKQLSAFEKAKAFWGLSTAEAAEQPIDNITKAGYEVLRFYADRKRKVDEAVVRLGSGLQGLGDLLGHHSSRKVHDEMVPAKSAINEAIVVLAWRQRGLEVTLLLSKLPDQQEVGSWSA